MLLIDPVLWEKVKVAHVNADPYARRTVEYAEDWANAVEQKMATGRLFSEVVDEARREADTDGITGYMRNAAVHILWTVWAHGESLRQWHNTTCGYPNLPEDSLVNSTILVLPKGENR